MTNNVYPRARCFQVRINTRATGKLNRSFEFDPADPVSRQRAEQDARAFAQAVKQDRAPPSDPSPSSEGLVYATLRPLLERYRDEVVHTMKGKKQALSRINIMLGVRAKRGKAPPRSRAGAGLAAKVLDRPLNLLEAADFQELVGELAATGRYVNSSINAYTSILSACLTWARKLRGMSWLTNQARGCTLRVADARNRTASDHEIDLILSKAGGAATQLAVLLLLETSARRSEIAKLPWHGVSLAQGDGAWPSVTFTDTKNGESRTVPLSPRAIGLLEALPQPHVGWVLKSPKDPTRHIRADSITQAFIRGRSRANLHDLRLHDLRHTATTRLAKVVKDALKLSKFTGHKDLRTLARYYNPSALDLAAEAGWGSVANAE